MNTTLLANLLLLLCRSLRKKLLLQSLSSGEFKGTIALLSVPAPIRSRARATSGTTVGTLLTDLGGRAEATGSSWGVNAANTTKVAVRMAAIVVRRARASHLVPLIIGAESTTANRTSVVTIHAGAALSTPSAETLRGARVTSSGGGTVDTVAALPGPVPLTTVGAHSRQRTKRVTLHAPAIGVTPATVST